MQEKKPIFSEVLMFGVLCPLIGRPMSGLRSCLIRTFPQIGAPAPVEIPPTFVHALNEFVSFTPPSPSTKKGCGMEEASIHKSTPAPKIDSTVRFLQRAGGNTPKKECVFCIYFC
jgi:hypothetical protein